MFTVIYIKTTVGYLYNTFTINRQKSGSAFTEYVRTVFLVFGH